MREHILLTRVRFQWHLTVGAVSKHAPNISCVGHVDHYRPAIVSHLRTMMGCHRGLTMAVRSMDLNMYASCPFIGQGKGASDWSWTHF